MRFWGNFFLTDHPVLAGIWVPLVGPVVAVVSFVCSIGNVPLVAVLWNGGISFGGVVAFIFADLIILPILNIYRKYYGWRMAAFIAATFYATMVLAGYAIELAFNLLRLVPKQRNASVIEAHISRNYTTWLNLVFLAVTAVLLARFFTPGGLGGGLGVWVSRGGLFPFGTPDGPLGVGNHRGADPLVEVLARRSCQFGHVGVRHHAQHWAVAHGAHVGARRGGGLAPGGQPP